jgi:hypothetical protein
MPVKNNTRINLVFAALFVLSFFFATHKVYHLPFSYGDDHRVLAMLHPEKAPDLYKANLSGQVPDLYGSLIIDQNIGRFRPLTWTYDKLLCVICGDNNFLWRASNLLILFLSVFFLLGILTLLNVDRISRFIVLAIYVFGRNNESWWTLIPPPQDVGECLLLAGMFVWIFYRKKSITGFYFFPALLFLLAGISKESFIFCIPLALLTDYFFFNPAKSFFSKEYWFSLLSSILPFLGLLITILHIKKVYAYPYPDSLSSILLYNLFQFTIASVFFIAPIVAIIVGGRNFRKSNLLKILIVTGLWLFIQLILLKGIKMDDQHHYLIPGLIIPLILTALSFSQIRKLSVKLSYGVFMFYSLVVLAFAWNTYTNSSSYSASVRAYYNMLGEVKRNPGASIVYLSDNACTGDWITGTSLVMSNIGIDTPIEFCTTIDSVPAWEKDYFRNSIQNVYKRVPFDSTLFRPDGKWILMVEDPAKNGFIKENISFYKKEDKSYLKVDNKTFNIPGQYFYFSMPYQGYSLGEIVKGNFNPVNCKGFYAIKLEDKRTKP